MGPISFIASRGAWRRGVRPIELHGTLASLRVPDPDTFGGDVELSGENVARRGHVSSLKTNPHRGPTPARLSSGIGEHERPPAAIEVRLDRMSGLNCRDEGIQLGCI